MVNQVDVQLLLFLITGRAVSFSVYDRQTVAFSVCQTDMNLWLFWVVSLISGSC